MLRRQHRHLGNFGCGGIGAHLGIGDEERAARRNDERQRRKLGDARRIADDVADVAKVAEEAPFHTADHGIRFIAPNHHARDHRGIGADQRPRGFRRDALAASDADVVLHVGAIARIVFRVDEFKFAARPDR